MQDTDIPVQKHHPFIQYIHMHTKEGCGLSHTCYPTYIECTTIRATAANSNVENLRTFGFYTNVSGIAIETTNEYNRTAIETLVHVPEVDAMLFRKLFPTKRNVEPTREQTVL